MPALQPTVPALLLTLHPFTARRFDDDWCMSAEGEPCNVALGTIETNTADYDAVHDRGDSDGVGGNDIDSRHHHAVRDVNWYGEDHKLRCVNWNAVNSYSSTHYCQDNQCRTSRGYNQDCNVGTQCHSGICYNGKCMASCAGGSYSAAAFSDDDHPNQCALDGQMCGGGANGEANDLQCGGTVDTPTSSSTCYIQAALGAAAGVCRPAGTECDWCERLNECDSTNSRTHGYFVCNLEFNECLYNGNTAEAAGHLTEYKAPDASACRNDNDCQSGQCASWAGDSDGTGNINRRFCRSRTHGPCGRAPTPRLGHPELAANYDFASNTGEHCYHAERPSHVHQLPVPW